MATSKSSPSSDVPPLLPVGKLPDSQHLPIRIRDERGVFIAEPDSRFLRVYLIACVWLPVVVLAVWWWFHHREVDPGIAVFFGAFGLLITLIGTGVVDSLIHYETRLGPWYELDEATGELRLPRLNRTLPRAAIQRLEVLTGKLRLESSEDGRSIGRWCEVRVLAVSQQGQQELLPVFTGFHVPGSNIIRRLLEPLRLVLQVPLVEHNRANCLSVQGYEYTGE